MEPEAPERGLSALALGSDPARDDYDAVVVGSGPNGLSAAIELARAGCRVLVMEAAATIGGGLRSAALTRPGFVHDVCSAIHPLGVASPFFRGAPLEAHGLQWVWPEAAFAHPLADGRAALASTSLDATAQTLGVDGPAYKALFEPFVQGADKLLAHVLGPFRPPKHPILLGRFGLQALRSAEGLAMARFDDELARGLWAGMAAHSVLPLDKPCTAAVSMIFGVTAHTRGWPLARGGSQQIADAMARYLQSLGGELVVKRRVASMRDLPGARVVLFDLTPRQVIDIAGDLLPSGYRRRLGRFRHGPGVFKLDWALDGPIPWQNRACLKAATVHVGGALAEVAEAERLPWEGQCAERPFVLVAQHTLFDPSRAPEGKHTGWAYCHVPPGSTVDMTARIEAQIERFAPGFRDRILARSVMAPADYEAHNENYVGGDMTGGVMDAAQLFTRPAGLWNPYATPAPGIFLCSSSTPPGPGVHGMCGAWAAKAALAAMPKRRLLDG